MSTKPQRLSKVAREFNLGLSTIVDFLSEKGFDVESKPNTKLMPEMMDVLVAEFQSDKSLKEKSAKISVQMPKRETVSIAKEEPAVKEEKIENKKPELFKGEASKPDVKVIGKIDLAPKKIKEAPKKVKEESKKVVEELKKEEPKKEDPKTKEIKKATDTVETLEKDSVKKEVKQVEVKPDVITEEKLAVKDEIYRADRSKLDGPKVLGKIVLPEVKKPVASSESADRKKRKRKRIKKDIVTETTKGVGRPVASKGKPFVARRGQPKVELTDEEVQKQVRETLARLSGGNKKKGQGAKFRRQKRDMASMKVHAEEQLAEIEKGILKVTEFVAANELASMMDVSVNEIISACMSLGMFVSINQRLDAETISIVADEFGFEVEFISTENQELIEEEEDAEEDLDLRAPIVTVMGHVDHGKTSLLDYIRSAKVADGEAGGITQHIGAYSVDLEEGKSVTFLDTPGHEAFTAMRARGAKVTDVSIIIIAADDQVMPQTKEAINHAQAAEVPMIFAINKIDKPGANADKVKEELSAMNILVEDWGGKFQCQEISAKSGVGIDDLVEKVMLEAEMMELKANANKRAKGTVIESELDKGRGYVSTILVQDGTLKVGDPLVAGCFSGKVKAMFDDLGNKVQEAGPSIPVQILGLNGAPQAGDMLNAMPGEKEAKDIATKRMQLQREQGIRVKKHITLDEIGRRIAIGDFKELNVIIKGDVDGSVEALSDSLLKLSTEQIEINIIHKSVGQISDSDVLLASASDAILIGFQVRPSATARKLAMIEEIEIRLYSVIYDAIDELKLAMEGMLSPTIEEKVVANVEVRDVFKITKVGTVAGCYVLDGKIIRNNKIRLIRDGIVVYSGALGSLKRFKDDVKEVAHGYECGLNIEKFSDIQVGDVIESYEEVEVKQTLK
ncbi:MAG: translation initiation factor IF-2 [Saprospiraceae bacterium]|jgi:translation initiation factor IF-2